MKPQTVDVDLDTVIIGGSDINAIVCAKHITIRSHDRSFHDLLALLDSESLACLLSGYIVAPDALVTVPWNGALSGQLQIVSVDSETSFAAVKRVDVQTAVEISRLKRERRQLLARPLWHEAVIRQYPGQHAALSQLIDIVVGQYAMQNTVGVLISGTDADEFVTVVAACSELPVHTISISAMFSALSGQAERRLQESFTLAREASPAMVIVQDLDLLQNSSQGERLRLRLEQILDDVQQQDGVHLVVLAPVPGPAAALPSSLRRGLRFDHLVPMRNLDQDGRCAILGGILGGDLDPAPIAAKAQGFSRGDLQRLGLEAALTAIGAGRRRISSDDVDCALNHIRPSGLDDRLRPSPSSLQLSELASIDAVIARLRTAVLTPLRHPESYRRLGIRPPRGVLLFGPSGVGKTTLALGIAAEANAAVIEARGCDLISAVVGESERAIRDLFERARAVAPAVVVLDQIETLAPRRDGDQSRTFDRVLSCLLTEMDGVTSRAPDAAVVVVIGTTAFRDRMDEAILRPGRFDEQIEIDLPDLDGRQAILERTCAAIPIAGGVDLGDLARRTSGYSGADLRGFCIEAAMGALRRDRQAGVVTGDDFDAAFPVLGQSSIKI